MALNPFLNGLSDVRPSLLRDDQVRASCELFIIRKRDGLLIESSVDSIERSGHKVVLAPGNEEEGSSVIIAMIDRIGRLRIETAKRNTNRRNSHFHWRLVRLSCFTESMNSDRL